MILELVVGAVLVFGLANRVYFMRRRETAFRGPRLHARIDALFDAYVGQNLAPEVVAALQAEADRLFRDVLTGVGLVPNEWRLVVQIDELLGPVPRVGGPDGQLLHVADFEQRIQDGRIDLPSA